MEESPFRFMDLPGEIRNMIYKEIHQGCRMVHRGEPLYVPFPAIMRVSKQFRQEYLAGKIVPRMLYMRLRSPEYFAITRDKATTASAYFCLWVCGYQIDRKLTTDYSDFSIYESILGYVDSIGIELECNDDSSIFVEIDFPRSMTGRKSLFVSATVSGKVGEHSVYDEACERLEDGLRAEIGKWKSVSSGLLQLSSGLLHKIITHAHELEVEELELDDEESLEDDGDARKMLG